MLIEAISASETTMPLVLASVELAVHGEAGFGGRGRDQLDDCPIADQRAGRANSG